MYVGTLYIELKRTDPSCGASWLTALCEEQPRKRVNAKASS